MPLSRSVKTIIALCSAGLILAGCATTGKPTITSEDDAASVTVDDPFVDQQLTAIESLLAQHQIDEAQALLNTLIPDNLTVSEKTRYVLAQAQLALLLGNGQQALDWLRGENAFLFDGLPLEDQINISMLRAEAYEFAGKPLSAARERIFVAPVLDEPMASFNREQIWFDLQLVPEEQLRALAEQESSPDLTGWITLALISQVESGDLYRLVAAIDAWQQQNPRHPAAIDLPASLQMLSELSENQPKQIGVLLPFSGPLEKAGLAIRNGLLTAWQQARYNEQTLPALNFYDTAAADDIQSLYLQALNDGAEAIIGPLSKANVQQLATLTERTIPTLALNYLDDRTYNPRNFYQFGLAPEDEARQIAEDTWAQGARSVMVLAPQSERGQRVSDAFIEAWQLKGGTIASKALFTRPDQYLGAIKSALNVTDSEQRHRTLSGLLDESLEFEFRRRQDIDQVFMVAFPAQARQLKPLLNYQRAIELPVVATSDIYAGKADASRDKDIEGVRFVEMPWRLYPSELQSLAQDAFPESTRSYATLVALGIDAYKLYPRLPQMAVFGDVRIQGVTGALAMNSRGRIERTLEWARIEKGLVVPAPTDTLAE